MNESVDDLEWRNCQIPITQTVTTPAVTVFENKLFFFGGYSDKYYDTLSVLLVKGSLFIIIRTTFTNTSFSFQTNSSKRNCLLKCLFGFWCYYRKNTCKSLSGCHSQTRRPIQRFTKLPPTRTLRKN